MGKAFYLRLALSNLRRNRRMVTPYFIATAVLSGMFFIILNLVFSQSIANIIYGPTLQGMLSFGVVVMAFFTILYMLYINSFLMSRRKTEFGLYGVLGLEKRHIGRIIFWENLMLSGGGLLLGLASGAVFGKLVFLILMRAMRSAAPGSTFAPTLPALGITSLIFFAVFLLTCLYNVVKVRLASPVDLLHGESKGEKKPRFTLPITLLGLLSLGGGYALSLMAGLPAVALVSFWPAVILVIIGTLCLFTAGSVFLLNRLRRNKKFYYQPRNFIAVSGLLHRMKQNAAGLANICILSTMVIITLTGCCSLFFGQEAILARSHPYDITVGISLPEAEWRDAVLDSAEQKARELAEEHGMSVEEMLRFSSYWMNFFPPDGMVRACRVITLEDYNRLSGSQYLLAPDELLVLSEDQAFIDELQVKLPGYRIEVLPNDRRIPAREALWADDSGHVIAADPYAVVCDFFATDDSDYHMNTSLYLDLSGTQEQGVAFSEQFGSAYSEIVDAELAKHPQYSDSYGTNWDSVYTDRAASLGTYGGLLFLGIFFTILFLTNTVIIIYFKQVSEGMEDRERFEIMQKVGMSDQEVRSTINRQVLIVFFLPLVGALAHTAAAGNIMVRLLELFWLYDARITLTCMGVTSLCFALVYIAVYIFTARTYYKIVKW